MLESLKLLDRILRGEETRPAQLADGKLTFPIPGVSAVGIGLAMTYGLCMGLYSILRAFEQIQFPGDYRQLLASTLKTPALFFLTLVVTFPSLYVFNALIGSRLQFGSVLRLLLAALGVNLAVLASFGPIVAFFSLSTDSYGFMVLLNVAMFATAGLLGLMFLIQTLNRLQQARVTAERLEAAVAATGSTPTATSTATPTAMPDSIAAGAAAQEFPTPEPTPPQPGHAPIFRRMPVPRPGAIDQVDGAGYAFNVRLVFGIWIFVFGIVGAQMGWILRPFIGSPDQEFTWFRPRDSNFFQAVSTTFFDTVFGGAKPPRGPHDGRAEPWREGESRR